MMTEHPLPSLKRKAIVLGLCLLTSLLSVQTLIHLQMVCAHQKALQCSLQKSAEARRRQNEHIRSNWKEFEKSLSDRHFRQMFRMSNDCFNALCKVIEMNVGAKVFCSESFIKHELKHGVSKLGNMFQAHKAHSVKHILDLILLPYFGLSVCQNKAKHPLPDRKEKRATLFCNLIFHCTIARTQYHCTTIASVVNIKKYNKYMIINYHSYMISL
jgi:hypothetical protein